MTFNPLVWLARSPFNPYWLQQLKIRQGNRVILAKLAGRVLEVGAGDGARKGELTDRYPHITKYLATDFSSWDDQFDHLTKVIRRLGTVGEALLGFKPRARLDAVADALDLPYPNNSFDWHLSFETLEHLSDPDLYLAEAARVVKKGGYIAFSIPFLYRVHGGEPDHRQDFGRYAPVFFHDRAAKHQLKLVTLYHNTGLGTTVALLINGWLIRRLFESWFLVRGTVAVLAPAIFLVNNLVGWLVDLTPDRRFATRWHILYRRK